MKHYTIDKFIGDGIMIFFGDPETRGDHEEPAACVRMALAMRDRVAETRAGWKKLVGPVDLHVRMEIKTGFCTVGNFGSSERLDYTLVGREVNAASRLESSAEPDQIRTSDETITS